MPDGEALIYITTFKGEDINNVKEALDTLFEECNREKTTNEIFDSKQNKSQEAVNVNVDTRLRNVQQSLETIHNINYYEKGRFLTAEELIQAYPNPKDGSYAYIGTTNPYQIWVYNEGTGWIDSGETYDYLPYKIQVMKDEELENMSAEDLKEGVLYLGTSES
jgi:hypothetical protein